ncbi:RnfABCDGE type electron transport complex subunit D [Halovulum sp. GXIMD14794]
MIRGVWNRETVGWVLAASTLPVLAGMVAGTGPEPLLRLGAGLAVVALWQLLFRALQGVPPTPAGAVTAVAVTVLAGPELALWQVILAISFGTVIAELIFGGWGRNVFGAGTAALAFLYLSFPGIEHPALGMELLAGCVAAGAILLATGILPPAVVVSGVLGWSAVCLLLGADPWAASGAGTLAFGLVYLLGDPVASAATPGGRWAYGTLGGALAALLVSGGTPQAAVFATLLASIAAPLIDQGAISVARYRRSLRHG